MIRAVTSSLDETLYRGLTVAGVAGVAMALLLLASGLRVVDLAIALLAVVLVAEGFGLAINWRGGTRAIVVTLRQEGGPSLLSLMPAWAWRLMGLCLAFIGFVALGMALSSAT